MNNKSFDISFSPNPHWEEDSEGPPCMCTECKHRVEGRFIIRGCLKYLDHELKDDPWQK